MYITEVIRIHRRGGERRDLSFNTAASSSSSSSSMQNPPAVLNRGGGSDNPVATVNDAAAEQVESVPCNSNVVSRRLRSKTKCS